ncbi:MAG: hypothetical protein J6S76_08135 [Clostridia bacterium]|nr:hypothetical protein [Clostridia bacterium]
MKHIIPDYSFPADLHTAIEDADFSMLEAHYADRIARYGDFHAHSASGGTSDGGTTPEEWLAAMPELKIDFIGIMDHRQVRHMYLDAFTPERFLYGTEPVMFWNEPYTACHYLMIFQNLGDLETVLERYPDVFDYEGGVEGHFVYKRIDFARFLEIGQAVQACGGAFVNAHPMQAIQCDDINYFDFGDRTAIEVIYTYSYPNPLNPHTIDNYQLWLKMLDAGKRIYNTATADAHGAPTNTGINTVYTQAPICKEYVQRLREGDLNAGCVGIQMTLGNSNGFVPMGGTIPYANDLTLCLRVADGHPLRFGAPTDYRVDIFSDQGLAYSVPLSTLPFTCAIKAQNRRFYRAEVIGIADGAPAAIGNPIWIRND